MEIVETLDGELLLRVGERKQTWAMRFESGLQNSHSDELEDFLPQKTFDQMKDHQYWLDLVSDRQKIEKRQRESTAASGQPYIPGIPDEIVQNHIWPLIGKNFRGISACQRLEKEAMLSALFSIRLLNKRWKHVVDFSYEWAVFRMVRRDFNEGWVWYSYFPSLTGPLTELSRMMDLLPDPSVPKQLHALHKSMGSLSTEALWMVHKSMGLISTESLWIWRSFLNVNRLLRYDHKDLHCGKAPDGFFRSISPCEECIFYPRSIDRFTFIENQKPQWELILERNVSEDDWDEEDYQRYCRERALD